MTELDSLVPEPSPYAVGGRVRSPVAVSLVGKALEAVTLVALFVLLPRLLGPVDYGIFSAAMAVVAMLTAFLALGGPTLLSRFVPAASPEDRLPLARALSLRLLRVRAAQLALVAFGAAVLVALVPDRFPPLLSLLVVLAIVLDVVATLGYQILLSLGHTRMWSLRFPFQNTVLCVAVIVLYEGIGATGALLAIVVSTAAALAVSAFATMRALRGRLARVRLPEGALRFGTIQAVGGLFVVVSQRGPVVVVALITHSGAEAGYVALATGVTLALTFVVWQVFAVELPRLSALVEHAPADASASSVRLATRATLVLIPVAALCVVAVDRVLPAVLGSAYEGAATAFGPALAVLPLVAVGSLVGQVSALRLRPVARAVSTGLGMLTFLAVAAVAVPRYEAVGGTLAFLAGTAVATLAGAVAFPHAVSTRLAATALGGSALILVLAWVSL